MLYKVLAEDGTPFHGGSGRWALPADGKPGAWMPRLAGRLVACRYGYHLCERDNLIYWLGPTIWEAETRSRKLLRDGTKSVVSTARLLRRLETWNPRTQRLFAADCAERALERERAAGREPHPDSWRAIAVARRYANSKATPQELAAAAAAAAYAAYAATAAYAAYAATAAYAAYDAAYDAAYAAYAATAAYAAAYDAAHDAAHAAYDAAHDARAATYAATTAAAYAAERQWQTTRLWEYLDGEL